MILYIAALEKDFWLETEDVRGRVSHTDKILLVMYRSLRHYGIDAIDTLRSLIVMFHSCLNTHLMKLNKLHTD